MDAGERQHGRKLLLYSVVILHVWGSILVWAVYNGKDGDVIADMFHAIGLSIVACLGVLSGEKGLLRFIELRSEPRQETTLTKTTVTKEPQQDEQPPSA